MVAFESINLAALCNRVRPGRANLAGLAGAKQTRRRSLCLEELDYERLNIEALHARQIRVDTADLLSS